MSVVKIDDNTLEVSSEQPNLVVRIGKQLLENSIAADDARIAAIDENMFAEMNDKIFVKNRQQANRDLLANFNS